MSQDTIEISNEIIDWAIDKVQANDYDDLVLKHLKAWKTDYKPSFKDIEKISNKTKIPLGYFFKQLKFKKTKSKFNRYC